MELQILGHRPGRQLAQLGDRPHAVRVAFFTAPDGQRRAPVAVAAQRPVDVVGEPLAEAPRLDVLGMPDDVVVGLDELVLDRRGPHVPRRLGVVEQGRVAAPAEGIAVLVGLHAEQQAAGLELGADGRVCVFDEDAGPRRDLGDEAALEVDGVDDRQVVLEAHAHVVLAEGGGHVDDAGAVAGRDEVGADHEMRPLVELHEGERRLVLEAEQLASRQLALDDGLAAEHLLDQLAGQHEALAAALDEGVDDLGMDRRGDVADQRPRRGRPHGQGDGRACRRAQRGRRLRLEREAHVDRILGDVLVALRDLVAADRRAAARAVRHHLVPLIEQALVPDLPQQPPDALDVLVVEGVVGVAHVDPEADALGEALPLLQVGGDALAAVLVEGGDAVVLDLLLAVDPQPALDLELDGQAVRVPARLARHAVAAHRLVAREEVLEDARDDVVRTGAPVGRGRALVEHVHRRVVAPFEALLEDAVLFPEREDAGVERREVDARGHLAEPGSLVAHVTRFRRAAGRKRDSTRHGRGASPPAHRAQRKHVGVFRQSVGGAAGVDDPQAGQHQVFPRSCICSSRATPRAFSQSNGWSASLARVEVVLAHRRSPRTAVTGRAAISSATASRASRSSSKPQAREELLDGLPAAHSAHREDRKRAVSYLPFHGDAGASWISGGGANRCRIGQDQRAASSIWRRRTQSSLRDGRDLGLGHHFVTEVAAE